MAKRKITAHITEKKKRNGKKEYKCNIVSSNGNVLFHGSGWNTKASAENAVNSIKERDIVIVYD